MKHTRPDQTIKATSTLQKNLSFISILDSQAFLDTSVIKKPASIKCLLVNEQKLACKRQSFEWTKRDNSKMEHGEFKFPQYSTFHFFWTIYSSKIPTWRVHVPPGQGRWPSPISTWCLLCNCMVNLALCNSIFGLLVTSSEEICSFPLTCIRIYFAGKIHNL